MRAAFYIVSLILIGTMIAGLIYVVNSRSKRHGAWASPALVQGCAPSASKLKCSFAAS